MLSGKINVIYIKKELRTKKKTFEYENFLIEHLPPSVQASISNGRISFVCTFQIHTLVRGVDIAMQYATVVGALTQHGLLNGHHITVTLFDHTSNFETRRRRTGQTVNRPNVCFKRLTLPRFALGTNQRNKISITYSSH